MKLLARLAGIAPAFIAVLLFPALSIAQIDYPDYKANDDATGQEYQEDIDAAVQPDGSWTAVWLDFRLGYPALFMRAFDPSDAPLGPSAALTDGFGVFNVDLNAVTVGQPCLAPLGDGRSLLVWSDDRHRVERVRAAIIGPGGILAGPVTVSDDDRPETRTRPRVAISGDRALVVWIEGAGGFTAAFGQVLAVADLSRVHDRNVRIDPEGIMPQSDCVVAPGAGGGWIAGWIGWQEGVPTPRILVRGILPGGDLAGARIAVDPASDWSQGQTALASTSQGAFVAWVATQDGRTRLIGREIDAGLDPLGPAFDIVSEGATITPSEPQIVRNGAGSVLAVWRAGNASRSRFYSRNVELPSTPTGDFVIFDDPSDPPGGLLLPRNLSVRGGDALPIRFLWTDNREGWDLDYFARADSSGHRVGDPTPLQLAHGSASQVLPAVALFVDEGALAVWEDFRTGGLSIFGRFLTATGVPQGGSFRISEASSGSVSVPATNLRDMRRNQPAVVTTSDGHAVVAWTQILSAGESRVILQHFDRNGNLIGNNVNLPGNGAPQSPQLASLQDGKYWVVWRDVGSQTSGDIIGRPFYSDGTVAGDTVRVVDRLTEGAGQVSPAIAASGAGELVVTWLDDRRGNMDVFAQRISGAGNKIERNIAISGYEGNDPVLQANPAVAAASDRYVVVWDENPVVAGQIAGDLIILPSAKTNGVAEEVPFTFGTGSPGYKYPRVAMDPTGRFVVTYWDTSADSARVMAQRFSATAVRIGAPYPVLAVDGRTAAIPGDVVARSDLIQYVYADSRDARGWDVHVRRVDWNFSGEYTAVMLAGAALAEETGSLVLRWSVPIDLAGGAYRVWRSEAEGAGERPGPGAVLLTAEPVGPTFPGGADYAFRDDTAAYGIEYAYWLEDATGDLAGPWTGAVRGGSAGALSLRASRNPFRESVRLAWSAPRGAVIDLSIHDASGRLVRRMDAAAGADGRGEAIWDGRDGARRAVPAGMYWARLRAMPGGERSARILRLR